MKEISARWNEKQTTVYVFLGDRHVANVVAPGGKWYVIPLTLGRRRSRKRYEYPSEAIKAYFGKNLQIRSTWPISEVIREAEKIVAAHAQGAEMDKGFDAGEFSGPAHSRMEENAIEGLALRSGVSSEVIWNEINNRTNEPAEEC